MKDIIFLIVNPALFRYAWECELLIENLLEKGVELNQIHFIGGIMNIGHNYKEFHKLSDKYGRFFFYLDNRKSKKYPSSIRPHLIAKHLKNNPDLQGKTIFYIDSDILFTKPINSWIDLLLNDDINYISDCKWYISYDYFKKKIEQVSKNIELYNIDDILQNLCNKINIPFQSLIENNDNSGGAQYILKKTDIEFWDKIEVDSEIIYQYFIDINNEYFDSQDNGIQAFCADMWSILWNLWAKNVEVKVDKHLDFAWATSPTPIYDQVNIYHNAGVVNNNGKYFYKAKYTDILPYFDDFTGIDINNCSHKYSQNIIQIGKNTCLL